MTSNQVLCRLSCLLPIKGDQAELVIWYGNRQGRDIDLLVILSGELAHTMIGYCSDGLLDVGFVGKDWIPTMIKHLDPIIVEPMLTGEIICGKDNQWKQNILKQVIDEDIPIYLLQSAEIFYEWAVNLVFEDRFREAVSTLCFARSFILYAERYWSGKSLVLFKDLLSGDDGLCIRQDREKAKKKKLISELDVCQALTKTRLMLTDLRVIVGCI
jgi:hypothetical protein